MPPTSQSYGKALPVDLNIIEIWILAHQFWQDQVDRIAELFDAHLGMIGDVCIGVNYRMTWRFTHNALGSRIIPRSYYSGTRICSKTPGSGKESVGEESEGDNVLCSGRWTYQSLGRKHLEEKASNHANTWRIRTETDWGIQHDRERVCANNHINDSVCPGPC